MKQSQIQAGYIKKLKWAFWLSQTNLDDLRQGDWINLREDYFEFVYGTKRPQHTNEQNPGGVKFASIPVLAEEDFKAIQSGIKTQLLRLAKQQTFPLDYQVPFAGECIFIALANGPSEPFAPAIWIVNDEIQALAALWWNLAQSRVTPEQIRVCSLEGCQKLFLSIRRPRKDKKKFYCSTRCAKNAATQAYRDRHNEDLKTKERERSHRRYEKKQRTKYPNAKVARRPRKAGRI